MKQCQYTLHVYRDRMYLYSGHACQHGLFQTKSDIRVLHMIDPKLGCEDGQIGRRSLSVKFLVHQSQLSNLFRDLLD